MKNLNNIILVILISALSSVLTACSEENSTNISKKETNAEHVWKQQTDTLKTSKDVAKKLQDSLNQQQKKLDESN